MKGLVYQIVLLVIFAAILVITITLWGLGQGLLISFGIFLAIIGLFTVGIFAWAYFDNKKESSKRADEIRRKAEELLRQDASAGPVTPPLPSPMPDSESSASRENENAKVCEAIEKFANTSSPPLPEGLMMKIKENINSFYKAHLGSESPDSLTGNALLTLLNEDWIPSDEELSLFAKYKSLQREMDKIEHILNSSVYDGPRYSDEGQERMAAERAADYYSTLLQDAERALDLEILSTLERRLPDLYES